MLVVKFFGRFLFLIVQYSHLQYPFLVLRHFDLSASYSVNLQLLLEAYVARQDTVYIHLSMTLAISLNVTPLMSPNIYGRNNVVRRSNHTSIILFLVW